MSEFQWPVRVYYEDTDSGGVVYYANYLRFMERARTEWMRALGFEQDRLSREEGIVFAVRSASIEFLQPARFNDLLTVTTQLQQCGRASLTFAQSIGRQHEESQPCCTGEVKVACVNADTFRPQSIPETLMKEIADVN
ncbi:MAG: tol-pal system-associated acyl-CoA thioesterase [Pseudomonadota bacterium]